MSLLLWVSSIRHVTSALPGYNTAMSQIDPMTRDQIREVDRAAIEDIGIPGVVLMENAARGTTEAILDLLDDPAASRVAVVCGAGNNGGDGFAIARHLHNARVDVTVFLTVPADKLKGDAETNYGIVERMGIAIHGVQDQADLEPHADAIGQADVVVDAMLGTGFSGEVRSPMDEIIRRLNDLSGPKIVAVDVPSGLDCDAGEPTNATVRADLTVTFVAPKSGFEQSAAKPYLGRVTVVDIGAPRELIDKARQAS